ncbi:MAG: hypothetical protein R3D85_11550, partial [Paracoccaceae bacterium]
MKPTEFTVPAARRVLPALALGLLSTAASALDTFTDGVYISDDADPNTNELLVVGVVSLQADVCVGAHCWAGGGFDAHAPLKIQTPKPGLEFRDTSTTFGEPGRDWRIEANEEGYGTRELFAIRDVDAGTRPFMIDAAAPDNALWIDDTGALGLGTSLPGTDLHILTGLQPAIRLEQDGSAGKTPGRWDLELRSTDRAFALRNADSGIIPVFVAYDAEANALALANDAVGIGLSTGLPRAKLHIDLDTADATYPYGLLLGDGIESGISPDLPGAMAHIISHQGNAQLKIEEKTGTASPRTLLNLKNKGRPEIVMANTDTGGEWSFGAGTNFILKQGAVGSTSSAKTKLFEIDDSGNATLTGTLTTGGTTCGGGCDRVFTEAAVIPQSLYAT